MKHLFRIAGCVLALISFAACATPYMADDIHGRVVDAETRVPLEGVIIVAKWELFEAGPGHGGHYGKMMNMTEVVTDREGEFVVPGWGPRIAPPFTYLDDGQPVLLMFKSGYEPLEKYSDFMGAIGPATYESHSSLDGHIFTLNQFTGTASEYGLKLMYLQDGLGWGRDNYNWKSYLRMIIALDKEREHIERNVPITEGTPMSGTGSLHGGEAMVNQFLQHFKDELE